MARSACARVLHVLSEVGTEPFWTVYGYAEVLAMENAQYQTAGTSERCISRFILIGHCWLNGRRLHVCVSIPLSEKPPQPRCESGASLPPLHFLRLLSDPQLLVWLKLTWAADTILGYVPSVLH